MQHSVTDMTGRQIEVSIAPKRIISLVPSQTELLFDLGLGEEVVGITKFCIHPNEWFRSKKRVGGTKTVHIDIVRSLQPDLILANKEENTREQVEELSALFPVWISDIRTVEESLTMIREVGAITGRAAQSAQLINAIQSGFKNLTKSTRPLRVAYFIWRKPWMCAGGDTFISDMIAQMGWENVLADKNRYPELELADLLKEDPDLILLSSEPYPFKDAHIAEIQTILPRAKVMLVDGEMFSWYGSRMLKAVDYLGELVSGNF